MGTEWLDTTANVFASIGTLDAFGTGFVLLRREHRRGADRTEDERRAQASKVSAWVELFRTTDGSRELMFHVHNSSDMPIYEVELPLPTRGDDRARDGVHRLSSARSDHRRQAPHDWLASYIGPEPIEIEFLDGAGWQWRRDEQGALVRAAQRAIAEQQ